MNTHCATWQSNSWLVDDCCMCCCILAVCCAVAASMIVIRFTYTPQTAVEHFLYPAALKAQRLRLLLRHLRTRICPSLDKCVNLPSCMRQSKHQQAASAQLQSIVKGQARKRCSALSRDFQNKHKRIVELAHQLQATAFTGSDHALQRLYRLLACAAHLLYLQEPPPKQA